MAAMNVSALLLFLLQIYFVFAKDLARGWGDEIAWTTLEEGLPVAKEQQKPVMVIIHKTWCGACKALKPVFAASDDIKTLSSKFVMVNAEDDEEPKGEEYTPDGGYIPRILFLDSDGKVNKDLINADGNENYKYYYFNAESVLSSMQRVLGKSDQKLPPDEL